MRIIIAMDIIGGKCVRLQKGDYSTKKIYSEDPLDMAKMISDGGINYLHLVDLDGAREKKVVNQRILEKIASQTNLRIDFGGGIRSDSDISSVFNSGALQVTAGTISSRNPELFLSWISKYGSDRIILGADANNRKIATEGWMDESGKDVIEFISGYAEKGVKYCICTDIEKDGMLSGPSTLLYREILEKTTINLIASGGISSFDDVIEAEKTGCEGVIIGKAFYEGRILLKNIEEYAQKKNNSMS